MTTHRDPDKAADVAQARWRATEFDLGEPYITHPTFKVGPAAVFACFVCVMAALVLCVVVVQAAQHWRGLAVILTVAFVLTEVCLFLDRAFAWVCNRVGVLR